MKKQLIMESAIELFAEQGFKATSIQQITDNCSISKGAFYLSFNSKDELILEIIDYFMIQFIANIDYVVNNTKENETLLYNFYNAMFESFQKRSNFAKIFIKEQTQSFNEELILKVHYYERKLEEIIMQMIEQLYGEKIQSKKYDLIYTIKGFMKSYPELFLFYNIPLDFDLLAKSLSEKTHLLANYMTVPFITKEQVEIIQSPMDMRKINEQVISTLNQNIAELEDSIEKESLIILKQHIHKPTFNHAIISGLLKNIEAVPSCRKVSYLLQIYFNQDH